MFNILHTASLPKTKVQSATSTPSELIQKLGRKGLMIGVAMEQNTVQLHLVGKLNVSNSPMFKELVKSFVGNGYSSFVFNLSGLSQIDSAGVAILVNAHNQAVAANGSVTVTEPQTAVYRTLVAVNFHHIVGIKTYTYAA